MRYYEVRLGALSPKNRLRDRRRQLENIEERMRNILKSRIGGERMRASDVSRRMSLMAERTLRQRQKKYSMLVERMRGLNPLDRLKAGFSFVSDEEGRAITRISGVKAGQILNIHVTDGVIKAGVQETSGRNISE
jgi:exodeoxyribonuclease VII large subunit